METQPKEKKQKRQIRAVGSVVRRVRKDGSPYYMARRRISGEDVYGPARSGPEGKKTAEVIDLPALAKLPSDRVRTADVPTLQEWAAKQMDGRYGKRIARTTHITCESIRLKYLVGTPIGKTKLDKLTRSQIQDWIDSLTDLQPHTVRRIFGFVSKLCSLAETSNLVTVTPCRRVELPSIPERDNATLTPTQVSQLDLPTTRMDHVVRILANTGFRKSELLRLEWDDVSESTGQLFPPGTKNARATDPIPLIPEVLESILAQPRRSKYVFTTDSGRPLSARNLSRDFEQWKKAHNINPRTRIQDLRGTYVSLLIESGADPKTTQVLARHADFRTTMKSYARSRNEVQNKAVQSFRDHVAKSNKQVETNEQPNTDRAGTTT